MHSWLPEWHPGGQPGSLRRALIVLVVLGSAAQASGCGTAPPGPSRAETAAVTISPPPATDSVATDLRARALTGASKRLVCETLGQELTADVYLTKGFAPGPFVEALRKTLDAYQTAEIDVGGRPKKSRFRYRIHEVVGEDDISKAKKEGLSLGSLPAKEGDDRLDLRRGFIGIVFHYGGESDVLPFWPPDEIGTLEFWLTSKMRGLAARVEHTTLRFGLVSDKRSLALDESNLYPGSNQYSVRQIIEQQFPYYRLEDVAMGSPEEIDPLLRGIIVTQPEDAYSEADLKRLDDFLLRGEKTLVFYVGAVHMPAFVPTMRATLGQRGLERLLGTYGIEMTNEMVLDGESALGFPAIGASGADVTLRDPAILVLKGDRIDSRFAPFFQMPAVRFPFASPLVAHPEAQPKAKLRVVAKTLPSATVDGKVSFDLTMAEGKTWPQSGPASERAVAIAVEGTIRSAFGTKTERESVRPSKVLVVASPQFLANPFARAGNAPPMPPQMAMMGPMGGDERLQALAGPYAEGYLQVVLTSFKNTLDWAADMPEYAELSARLLEKPAKAAHSGAFRNPR